MLVLDAASKRQAKVLDTAVRAVDEMVVIEGGKFMLGMLMLNGQSEQMFSGYCLQTEYSLFIPVEPLDL